MYAFFFGLVSTKAYHKIYKNLNTYSTYNIKLQKASATYYNNINNSLLLINPT